VPEKIISGMKTRVHVFISGRVQGVFFRASTKEEADGLGITGWVRNVPDGRVEVVFEGDEVPVESMLSWCHRGPTGSRVSDVEVKREEYRGEFDTFSVRYLD
jgi:acylphosphatase